MYTGGERQRDRQTERWRDGKGGTQDTGKGEKPRQRECAVTVWFFVSGAQLKHIWHAPVPTVKTHCRKGSRQSPLC